MAYTKVHANWKNHPDTTTPITAPALDQIEAGIAAAASTADAAETPAGAQAKADAAQTNAAADATTKANAAQAAAVQRANHTGTQPIASVVNLQATLDTKLAGLRVEDDGVSTVAAATALNFAGAGVTVTDAGANEATVTIPGGGGGGTLGGARVTRSASQAIGSAAFTAITFPAEDYDTDAYHDNTTNPSRLTAPATGVYLFGGHYVMEIGTATTHRYVELAKNGARVVLAGTPPWNDGGFETALSVQTVAALTAGDYVELRAFQDTGSNKNVTPASFYIERLR